jgi:Tfp pilus assembly protein PilV
LFEVLVAIGVSTLIVVAVVSLVTNSIRNTTFSKNKTLAARYAQDATEWLRGQRDANIADFRVKATGTYCFNTLSWGNPGVCQADMSGTIFRREGTLTINQVSGKTVIEADVKVYWDDAQGTHEVRSATNFTDWRER